MATTVSMPQLGESVVAGTIGKLLKAPGDRVGRDESIVEVMTDKGNQELPSPVAGVIEQIVVKEGDVVPVGGTILVIGDGSGLGAQSEAASSSTASPAPASAAPVSAAPAASASPALAAEVAASAPPTARESARALVADAPPPSDAAPPDAND